MALSVGPSYNLRRPGRGSTGSPFRPVPYGRSMTYADNLWLFFILLLGIIVVPGMDMLFVLANALTGGRRAGMAATAGIMLGGLFHTAFGVLGVGIVLSLAPGLFAVLLLAGTAYMGWIGLTLARSSLTVSLAGTP